MTCSSLRIFGGGLLLLFSTGCERIGRALEDNGTHLAYALEKGVKELRMSTSTEAVVHYETLDGPDQSYYIEVTPSVSESGKATDRWGSYLVVSGKTSGGTSYHNRFIFVPKRLYIQKANGGAELLLHKEGDQVDLVGVR